MCTSHFPGFEMPQQPGTTSEDESRGWKQVEDTPTKHVQFLEPLSKIVMEDAKGESDNAKNQPYVPAVDDPPSSSNSPLLSPVLEEPSSSSEEGKDLNHNCILIIPLRPFFTCLNVLKPLLTS